MEKREPVDETKRGLLVRLKSKMNRRLVLALVLLGLVIAGLVAWWLYGIYGYGGNAKQISQFRQDYLALKKEEPTSAGQAAKADYYQLLASKAAKAGDFKGAVSAFEERKAVLGEKIPPTDFIDLAIFYCRMDDKEGAVAALDEGAAHKRVTSIETTRMENARKTINEQGCDAWVSPLDQQ